jgi:hypothetical protein
MEDSRYPILFNIKNENRIVASKVIPHSPAVIDLIHAPVGRHGGARSLIDFSGKNVLIFID